MPHVRRHRRFVSAALSLAVVLGGFTALTVVMTWPQARLLATHAPEHQDVYFNLWRLGWFAHALATEPTAIFDGNIFHPEPNTLTFSDAMVVEGLAGAPLLWAGVPPVLVHNLLLLGAIIASGVGMFVLVRHLTGDPMAAVAAGLIFAFAPYRFEHYMHMELQWTVWMPWAFWALHRTIESARWLHGVQAGIFVALQLLSSVYYGIYMATILPLVAVLLMLAHQDRLALRRIRALVLGGIVAVVISGFYALPYLEAKRRVGERTIAEIERFSARPSDYLIATPDNRIYGDLFVGRPERRLFPGLLASLLAIVGLLLRPPARAALAYLFALAIAFDLSLGLHGYSYRFLYEEVPVFSGLRVPARLSIFVVMFLAILAGYGVAAIGHAISPVARRVVGPLIACVLLVEYSVSPLQLVAYDNSPPSVYAFLASLPQGVVAEFPMPAPDNLPGMEPRYAYMSTFHWKPIVNGYSGYYPPSYFRLLRHLQPFPDESAIEILRWAGVKYLVVHLSRYKTLEADEVIRELQARVELSMMGRFHDGMGAAVVYTLE